MKLTFISAMSLGAVNDFVNLCSQKIKQTLKMFHARSCKNWVSLEGLRECTYNPYLISFET